jgi:hypothetical protein
MKKVIWLQFLVLLAGTAFAWFNFAQEYISWMAKKTCTLGCAGNAANPFLTSCFYGAIFFTIAFILNLIILGKSKK